MKKFGKTLALLAAGALLFGSVLSSCSSGSDDDDDDETPKITISSEGGATSVGVGKTLQLTAKSGDETLEGVTWTSSDTAVATVDETGLVTGVAAAESVTITAEKEGYDKGTITLAVKAEGDDPDTPAGNEEDVTATVFWNVTEYAAQVASDKATDYTENQTYGDVETIQPFQLRNAAQANSYTVSTETDISCTGYLRLKSDGSTTKKALKFTVPSDTKYISVVVKDGSSSNDANITLTDGTTSYINKALTTTDNLDYALIKSNEITLAADTVMYIYNAEAANMGGLNIQAIILWKAVKKNAAPAESLFTANSTADGYSITVSDPTGIEYSTDNGTTWRDAEATITLESDGKTALASGTVLFRTKKTDDALASSTVSVTVEEYKDTSLPTADKPSDKNFTVVPEVNGSDGSITLKSAVGIEYQNGDVWEAAETSYTGLAAGTYKFRTAAVADTSNASDALEVVVGTYTLPVTAETKWDLTDYTTNALYSGIPVRTGSDNVAAVITTNPVAEITSSTELTGYIGKGFWIVSGTAAEYVSGKGLGYSKWAGDKNGESDDKSGNANTPLPAIQSAGKITGPFKVTVTSPTLPENKARSLNFYVSSDASTLFNTVAYSRVLSNSDKSYTYIYAGEDEVYVGLGTVGTDGKVYTNISNIVLTAGATIPDDEFPATEVKFVDSKEITELTVSKVQATAEGGYQLETSITPAWSTDSVKYSFTQTSSTDENKTESSSATGSVSVSEAGVVTASSDFAGIVTGTVTATARDGVTKDLTLTVSSVVPLTAESVVTVTADKSTIYTYVSGDTATFTATLDSDYTDVTSYTWYVDDTEQTETSSTFKYTSTTVGEVKISAVAKSASVETAKSSAVTLAVSEDITEDSWNLLSPSKTITDLTTKGAVSTDTIEPGASKALNLTLSKSGTDVGSSKSKDPVFQYVSKKGLLIKNDALMIGGVKGKGKVTIEWLMNTKTTANNRYLEVTVGASGTTEKQGNEDTSTASATFTYTTTFETDTTGTAIYIGASNEIYIQSIKIEKVTE